MSGINIKEWTLAVAFLTILFASVFAILFVPGNHETATAGLASAFGSILGYYIAKEENKKSKGEE